MDNVGLKLHGSRVDKPLMKVKHAELKRYSDSPFRSICPGCNTGLLLVRRDNSTFEIQSFDICSLCGQVVEYEDIEDLRKGDFGTPVTGNKLIMPIGIPGSGKSFFIENLKLEYKIISPDEMRRERSDISDQSLNTEIWEEVKSLTISLLKEGSSVVVDAVNTSTFYRRKFIENLPECVKFALIFDVHPEVACERIRKDIEAGKDRSNVPPDIVYRMYGEFLYSRNVLRDEGFVIIDVVSGALLQKTEENDYSEVAYKVLGIKK